MPVLIPEKKQYQLIKEDGKTRLDGRALDEMRPFSCEIGVLQNADGSAFVSHGGNRIYAGVYGPRDVHPKHLARPDRGILRVSYRMATFSVHERASPAPNRRAHEISKIIEDAISPTLFLELYPNSAIEVYVTIIGAEGGTRCASTTAVSLALADAGLPMKTLTAGIAAGKANGKVILDCNDEEDKAGDADVPCAVQMKDEKISLLQFDGQMTPDELNLSLDYIRKGARQIFAKMTEAIKGKFEKIKNDTEEEIKRLAPKEEPKPAAAPAQPEAPKETESKPAEIKPEEPKAEAAKVEEPKPAEPAKAPEVPKVEEKKPEPEPKPESNPNPGEGGQ